MTDKPIQYVDFTLCTEHDRVTIDGVTYTTPQLRAAIAADRALNAARVQVAAEPVWIQPDHLQKARRAPFLCRVEPAQRDDFVPLYAAPVVQAERAGWRWVPVEPTQEMVSAMAGSRARDDECEFPSLADLIDYSGENKTRTVLKAAYLAALAASPEPAEQLTKD